MNEHEFREQYAALQKRTAVSPELKKQTAAHVRNASRTAAPRARVAVTRRWALPAAACLVAAAVVAGGVPVAMGILGPQPGISMSKAAETSGFAVRAYASDGSSLLELGADGTVVFDRVEPMYGIGDDYATEGFFTGCLFRVQGEGIERVQMNISSGKLYRYTVESFRKGDEPERMKELVSTKPLNRGMGKYYGAYDEAIVLPFRADTDVKNNPDAQVNVGLSKIYGSTIDITAADDPGITTGETAFGLWTNEGDPADLTTARDPFAAIIDMFENQSLTVTVTFEDGHTSTQVIQLHAADFLVDEGDPNDPNDMTVVAETVDPNTLPEGERSIHSLYGTVLKANHEAFPLPLDNANDMADTVLPAATLPRQDDTRPTDTVLPSEALRGKGETIDAVYHGDDFEQTLTFSYPSIERHSTPPNGKMPADFNAIIYGWFGDLAYVNKCSNEVFGYGFNDDGTLTSNEFTYVTVSFDVTNKSNDAVEIWPRAIGELAVIGNDGKVAVTNAGYDLDFEASANALPSESPQHVGIAAGDTVHITLLRVLSNRLADDDSLVFIPGDMSVPQAFAVGDQI